MVSEMDRMLLRQVSDQPLVLDDDESLLQQSLEGRIASPDQLLELIVGRSRVVPVLLQNYLTVNSTSSLRATGVLATIFSTALAVGDLEVLLILARMGYELPLETVRDDDLLDLLISEGASFTSDSLATLALRGDAVFTSTNDSALTL